MTSTIPAAKVGEVRRLYSREKLSMKEIAQKLGVSLDAVVYFMRRYGLKRRSFSEMNAVRFERKIPSFQIRKNLTQAQRELAAMGAMLYWGEGYKAGKASQMDFANSDPEMISVFLNYLRTVYIVDEKKFRILLYCYSNQNFLELMKFWSKITKVPQSQFTKPYVRRDFRKDGRKMRYGLIHVRYGDKKLLASIMGSIEKYKRKFAQVVPYGAGEDCKSFVHATQ